MDDLNQLLDVISSKNMDKLPNTDLVCGHCVTSITQSVKSTLVRPHSYINMGEKRYYVRERETKKINYAEELLSVASQIPLESTRKSTRESIGEESIEKKKKRRINRIQSVNLEAK